MPDSLPLTKSVQALLDAAGRSDANETPERVAAWFRGKGLPAFPAAVEAFVRFGGYTLPDCDGGGRFRLLRAQEALRRLRRDGEASAEPSLFRIIFGESETIQAAFLMDGHGRVYEDEARIADSVAEWLDLRGK